MTNQETKEPEQEFHDANEHQPLISGNTKCQIIGLSPYVSAAIQLILLLSSLIYGIVLSATQQIGFVYGEPTDGTAYFVVAGMSTLCLAFQTVVIYLVKKQKVQNIMYIL